MKTGKQEEQDLIKSIDEVIEKLKQDPFLGTYIENSTVYLIFIAGYLAFCRKYEYMF